MHDTEAAAAGVVRLCVVGETAASGGDMAASREGDGEIGERCLLAERPLLGMINIDTAWRRPVWLPPSVFCWSWWLVVVVV